MKTTSPQNLFIGILFLSSIITGCGGAASDDQIMSVQAPEKIQVAGLPLSFEQNQGQVDEQVKFLLKQGTNTTFFTQEEVVYTIYKNKPQQGERDSTMGQPVEEDDGVAGLVIRQSFENANMSPEVIGEEQLEGRINYFKGNNEDMWQRDIPTYAQVHYNDLYKGIDVVYSGGSGQLVHTYHIQPDQDPTTLQIDLEGIENLVLRDDGTLVMQTGIGNIAQQVPEAYQMINGEKVPVESSYQIQSDHSYGFAIGDYSPEYPLIITIAP